MLYTSDGSEINIGDQVLVEGNVHGVVVCNFDRWVCLNGFESWLTKEKLGDGGTFSNGVLIKTDELGFLHYSGKDESIQRIRSGVDD